MALSKIQAESMNLADTYAFSGTVSGTSVAGSGAFCARHTAEEWGSVANSSIVNFNNDSAGDNFDTDNNYSTSTYKYTAPATGVYMFWYSIYTANGDTGNGFTFLKNSAKIDLQGNSADWLSFQESQNDDHTQTATCVIPLSSGETMAVCGATQSDYYKAHCQWGGCRLA
tara:strand:- start:109 stop:618 length:510 start_codon:yes stop_codon:yes gene_type:complete